MKTSKLFLYGFLGTLVFILPIYLCYAAIGLSRTATVDASQAGVPVLQATSADATNILLASGDKQSDVQRYYIVRLDAYRNMVSATCFSPETKVISGGSVATLNSVVQSAGLAAGTLSLSCALNIDIPYYIFAPTSIWQQVGERLGFARIKMQDYTSSANLAKMQLDIAGTNTAVLTSTKLIEILNGNVIPQKNKPAVAAQGAISLLQGGIERLPATIDFLLRTNSTKLFTNITAENILDIERIAKYLVRYEPSYWADAMPANLQAGFALYDEETLALAKEYFAPIPFIDDSTESENNSETPTSTSQEITNTQTSSEQVSSSTSQTVSQ